MGTYKPKNMYPSPSMLGIAYASDCNIESHASQSFLAHTCINNICSVTPPTFNNRENGESFETKVYVSLVGLLMIQNRANQTYSMALPVL